MHQRSPADAHLHGGGAAEQVIWAGGGHDDEVNLLGSHTCSTHRKYLRL